MKILSAVFLSFLLLFGMTGCNQKVSSQTKFQLSIAASTAKERALTFSLLVPSITALDANDADAVKRWKASHEDGLAKEAKALADFVAAADEGFKKTTIREIQEMAITADERAQTFCGMMPKIRVTDDKMAQLMKAHGDALLLQAIKWKEIAASLGPKPETEPKAEPVSTCPGGQCKK